MAVSARKGRPPLPAHKKMGDLFRFRCTGPLRRIIQRLSFLGAESDYSKVIRGAVVEAAERHEDAELRELARKLTG